MYKTIIIIVGVLFAFNLNADEPYRFKVWLQQFKQEALAEGISAETVNKTIARAEFLPKVIRLDRSQPEFVSSFSKYVRRRVNENSIQTGIFKLYEQRDLLQKVEAQYQVPKSVLVAFWGLETNYGATLGDNDLVSALSTLAFEGRRTDFFKSQLIALMQIADAKHKTVDDMRGSWAGAFGQMQFMPTTFQQYAVDGNADNRINLWDSLPDAFSSAANYLSSIGWRYNEPIAVPVTLPEGFSFQLAHLKERHHVQYWRDLGVKLPSNFENLSNTAIILPQGWQGPAFMVFNNFDLVMQWNRSINYALAVALLADSIQNEKQDLSLPITHDEPKISHNQVKVIQTKLNAMGYQSGTPDGYPGANTQRAVRQYQLQHGMPADGYANLDLYYRLLKK